MNKDIKIGDLVETCSLLPGVVMKLEKQKYDTEIEVRMLHVDEYASDNYANCAVRKCGVRKITAEFAKMLSIIGPKRLGELYKSIEAVGEDAYNEYDKRVEQEYKLLVSKTS